MNPSKATATATATVSKRRPRNKPASLTTLPQTGNTFVPGLNAPAPGEKPGLGPNASEADEKFNNSLLKKS